MNLYKPVLCALALLSISSALNAADWPMYRGPNLNGISNETIPDDALKGGAKIVWKGNVSTGFAGIAVADGRIYTMGNRNDSDYVLCYDAMTGEEIWRLRYREDLKPNLYEGGPNATPTVQEGRVYTLSKSGKVHCLDAKTGKEIWKTNIKYDYSIRPPSWGFSSAPIVHNGMVLINAGSNGLALDATNGKLLWDSGKSKGGYATVVPFELSGNMLYAVFASKGISAVDARGKVQWDHPWSTSYNIHAADPIIDGNRIFISSGYGSGCTLIEVNGKRVKEVYKNREMRNQCAGSVLLEGHVYGFDGQVKDKADLVCLDFDTGKQKWSHDGDLGTGTLIVVGDKLVVLSERGELYLAPASPKGFKPLGSARILDGKCWTPPSFSNGHLYARTSDGDIVCVALK